MAVPQIVLDTNVLVSALRSQEGASYRLVMLIDSGKFEINLSVPLVLEYESTSKRLLGEIALNKKEIDDIINYLCRVGKRRPVYFLWRPFLKDPKDDMVLELAIAAGCDCIVTFNQDDFQGVHQFGIRVRTPKQFLQDIGELS